MKGYFTEAGKYKSYTDVLKISEADVKSKKIYDVYDKNAQEFNKAGSFMFEGQKVEAKKEPIKEETKKEVKKDNKKK